MKDMSPKTKSFVERFNGTVLDEVFCVKIGETCFTKPSRLKSGLRRLTGPSQHRTTPSGLQNTRHSIALNQFVRKLL